MIAKTILAHAPPIQAITQIQIPEVKTYTIYDDVPVYELNKSESGVIMLEVLFYAGRPQEQKKLVSSCCAPMMREGAGKYSSEALSEEIDFRGASISLMSSLDLITMRMVCLRKYFPEMIEIMNAIISEPHFDKRELEQFIKRRIERLQLELAKNDIVSYRELTERIYGSESPYGYNSSKERYEALTVADIREHYDKTIRRKNCVVFISGDIKEEDRGLVNSLVEKIPGGGKRFNQQVLINYDEKPSQQLIKGNHMQTSIKIGCKGLVRAHPDYYKLSFLNTLFGGFFGSRLVTNVRERLGLTYGIYSLMDSQLFDACLIVSTEVANENVQRCLSEIYEEMERLKTQRVGDEELSLVSNYMMGNYLNLFDGPFNSIKAIKSLVLSDIPLNSLGSLLQQSVAVTAEDVMEMAQKYFNSEDYWEVIVGTPSK